MSETPDAGDRLHRILVVDDDPGSADLVRSWYAGQPFEILAAPDGESGLEAAFREVPDVVLLDLKMPGVDGLGVVGRLKGDPATRAIPILMLTACRDVDAKIAAFAEGADDYVTKPFEFDEVDARIRSMLRRRETMRSLQSTIRELADANEQLEQLLMIDEKTGLYNFREFRRRLRDEWTRAERYGAPLSLVFLDIDDFKLLNDTFGHQVGDRVLAEFATLVAGGARANDVAARYGGEEFALILPHTDGEMALRVAERIRRAVAEFVFNADDAPTRITVSVGVSTFPGSGDLRSVDALVRSADLALYRAKDLGKDRVVPAGDRIAHGGGAHGAEPRANRRREGRPHERSS